MTTPLADAYLALGATALAVWLAPWWAALTLLALAALLVRRACRPTPQEDDHHG